MRQDGRDKISLAEGRLRSQLQLARGRRDQEEQELIPTVSSSFPPFLHLALAAALITRVESVGLTLFHDIDSFHGAREGADRNPVKFEALDFPV